MFFKILYAILNLFSLFNIVFAFEVLLVFVISFMVYLNKHSEDSDSQSKLTAPSSRVDDRIKMMYLLIVLFALNTLLLNVIYKKEIKHYKALGEKA